MLKHTISISSCLEVAVLALFCITKPRKKLEVDFTDVKKKNLKGFVELILGDMWLTFLNFEVNLAHGENSSCRSHRIVHGCSNKKSRLPCVNITKIYFWQKKAAKSDNLSPKSFSLTPEQTSATHLPLASRNACPAAIPEIPAQTQGSNHWQLIY